MSTASCASRTLDATLEELRQSARGDADDLDELCDRLLCDRRLADDTALLACRRVGRPDVVPALLYLCVLFWFGLIPLKSLPGPDFELADKVWHLMAFGGLTALRSAPRAIP